MTFFRLLRVILVVDPAVVAVAVARAVAIVVSIAIIVAVHSPILMDGLVLRAVMGAVLFVFMPFFVISAIISFRVSAMRFPILMDGLVPRAVMRAVLFVFVRSFVISAIVGFGAGMVMGMTVSMGKRNWGSHTER